MLKLENSELQSNPEVTPSVLLDQSDVVVLDLDGTLYLLDGDNNGFHNSSLNKQVLSNTKKLIIDKEGISEESAQELIDSIVANGGHLSISIGERYGLSREELFDITWDINPEGIVSNFDNAVLAIQKFHESGKQLILLTQAPKIWQRRVIKHLNIEKYFTCTFSGEQFLNKGEAFTQLLSMFPQKNILSIGDQLVTDIQPAIDLGMSGFQVTHPNDLLLLLNTDE